MYQLTRWCVYHTVQHATTKRMSTFPSIVLHDDSMKMRDIIRLYELQQDESMMMRLSIQCRINIVMHR
jgi:hypothetical protein